MSACGRAPTRQQSGSWAVCAADRLGIQAFKSLESTAPRDARMVQSRRVQGKQDEPINEEEQERAGAPNGTR